MNPVATNTTEKETVALQSTIARHDSAESKCKKGKKVFVNYYSFIKTITVSSNKRQNPALREVLSLGLGR